MITLHTQHTTHHTRPPPIPTQPPVIAHRWSAPSLRSHQGPYSFISAIILTNSLPRPQSKVGGWVGRLALSAPGCRVQVQGGVLVLVTLPVFAPVQAGGKVEVVGLLGTVHHVGALCVWGGGGRAGVWG